MADLWVDGRPIPLSDDGLPKGMPADHDVATLGIGVLIWAEIYLAQPDGPNAGDPWRWTATQGRIVAWWYAVDSRGRWVFRRGQVVLPKGRGKSPMAAAIACAELCGPVVFDRFDEDGEAVGKPHPSPNIQVAAVNEEQADNTMALALAMLNQGEARHEYGLEVLRVQVTSANGWMKRVTSAADSKDGVRLTAAILDETHRWRPGNNGPHLAEVMRANLAKTGGRSLETTNAWAPGEGSVAEATATDAENIAAGLSIDVGLMRFHPVTVIDDITDVDEVRAKLTADYADSPWMDIDAVLAQFYDPSSTEAHVRRVWCNEVSASITAWLTEAEWAGRAEPDKLVLDGDTVVLGFDGSQGRTMGVADATALMGVRVRDGHLFTLGIWAQPPGAAGVGWKVPVAEVLAAVRTAFDTWNVVGLFADPSRWEGHVAEWGAHYRSRLLVKASAEQPCRFTMTGARSGVMARALEALRGAILDGEMTHDGNYLLTQHALNARMKPGQGGIQIEKPSPDRKIDAIVAATLAWQARLAAVAAGIGREPPEPPRSNIPFRIA